VGFGTIAASFSRRSRRRFVDEDAEGAELFDGVHALMEIDRLHPIGVDAETSSFQD